MNKAFFNNWFRNGYNNDSHQTKRTSSSDKFFIEFDEYSTNYVLPKREAFSFNNAKIKQSAGDSEIFVMLSGGYDSQLIAKTMAEDNIKFTALIFDFGRNINQFDVEFAKKLCNKYNIPYKIVSFDLIDFYETGEYKEYAEISHCNWQFNLAYMRGIRDITGVVVSGHGDQEFEINTDGKFWQLNEQNYCLLSYAKHINLDSYIRYYEFTKEIWYSMYENCWKNLKLPGFDEYYKIKNNFFTDLGLLERPKYNGFESYLGSELQPIRYQTHKYLLNKYPSSQNDIELVSSGRRAGDVLYIKVPF